MTPILKNIVLIAFLGACSVAAFPEENAEPEGRPEYSFSYDVQDLVTGDIKSQSETRDGDFVQGQYSLHDADGYRRIVEYTADNASGFKAIVRREPLNQALGAPKSSARFVEQIPSELSKTVQAPSPSQVVTAPPSLTAPSTPAPYKEDVKPQNDRKAYTQPAAQIIRAFAAPTLIQHHTPTHTLYHAAPTVHLTPAGAHLVHAAPATHVVHSDAGAHLVHAAPAATHVLHHAPATTLLKTSSPTLIAHHAAPAVVKASLATPQYSYVSY